MAADSLLARFIQRARASASPSTSMIPSILLDAAQWRDYGMAGRW